MFIRTNKVHLLRLIESIIIVEINQKNNDIEKVNFKIETELKKLKFELYEKIEILKRSVVPPTFVTPTVIGRPMVISSCPPAPIDFIFENLNEKMNSIRKTSAMASNNLQITSITAKKAAKKSTNSNFRHVCNICLKDFETYRGLISHSRIHKNKKTNLKPFNCICLFFVFFFLLLFLT